MIASTDRDNITATDRPGPAPDATSRCASRFAASSSSRYDSDRSPHVSATASGAGLAWRPNTAGTDVGDAGSHSTARLPQRSRRARSSASSSPSPRGVAPGSAMTDCSTCCNRRDERRDASSRRRRRCGTPRFTPIPAAARPRSSVRPARSPDPSGRSSVSTGTGVACRSPSASPAASLSCHEKFCHPSMTCTSG